MFNLNNVTLIFDENPISRAYLNLIVSKNYKIRELIYLGEKYPFPRKIIHFLKFHRNNYFAIKFLKKKNIDYFLNQVEEYFGFQNSFIKNMYQFNNLYKTNNLTHIKNNKINSENLIKYIKLSDCEIYINTGRQILKKLLQTNKKFLHIHPAYLPTLRGADGSLHSLDKYNFLASSSFFINFEIDKGELIFREKKNFSKFRIKDKNSYSVKDLYNLWFSFVDPLLRTSHLDKLFKGVKTEKNQGFVEKETESNYFTFMKEEDLDRVFKKIFE